MMMMIVLFIVLSRNKLKVKPCQCQRSSALPPSFWPPDTLAGPVWTANTAQVCPDGKIFDNGSIKVEQIPGRGYGM